MAQCSICSRGEETATTINEMLWAKKKLRDIEAAVGINFRSIHRHSHGSCVFGFPAYKAARIKNKSKAPAPGGRTIVAWPARGDQPAYHTLLFSEDVLHQSDLRPDDCIFQVRYAPNFSVELSEESRRTHFSDKLLDEALAENEARTSETDS